MHCYIPPRSYDLSLILDQHNGDGSIVSEPEDVGAGACPISVDYTGSSMGQ